MSAWTSIRWSGAIWALPLLFGLGVHIALTNPSYEVGYTAAEYASASRAVVFIGPALAALAALRLPVLRDALRVMRPQRSAAVAVLVAFWPLAVGGPAVGLVAMVSAVRAVPDDRQSWLVCAVVAVTLAACVCVGVLLAGALPWVVAVPVSALLCFSWLALPATGLNITLRNLNSSFVGCCATTMTPATSLIVGSLAVTGTIVVLALVFTTSRRWWMHGRIVAFSTAMAVLVVGAGAGYAAVAALPQKPNLLAVEPRQTPMKCESIGGSRVCVWPERSDYLADAAGVVARANEALVSVGLAPVKQVSERPSPGWVTFTAGAIREEDTRFSLAQGVVAAAVPTCQRPYRSSFYSQALAFNATLLGVGSERWAGSGYSLRAWDAAEAVRAESAAEQRAFLTDTYARVTADCNA